MPQIIDIFGETITQSDDGTWTRGGCSVGPCEAEQALATFNGMAPDGWVAPLVEQPAPVETITAAQLAAVLAAKGISAEAADALFAACAQAPA